MNSELSRKIIVASGLAVVVGIIAVTFAVRSKHPIPVAQSSPPPAAVVQTPDAPPPVAPTADAPAAVAPVADVAATDKLGAKSGDAASPTAVEPKVAGNGHPVKARIDADTAERTVAPESTVGLRKNSADASLAKKTDSVKKVDELPMPATVSRTVPEAQDGTTSNEPTSSDTLITTEVKSQFAADSISKDVDIGVTTTQGVVVLSGTLVTQDAIDHIRNVAEKVKDVKSVDISAMKITST